MIIEGRSKVDAYRDVYPNANKNSADKSCRVMLARPEVDEYREALQERMRISADLDGERLAKELSQIVLSDIRNVCGWDGEGRVRFTPSAELPPEVARTIRRVKCKIRHTGQLTAEDGEILETDLQIELEPKVDAAKVYAQVTGIMGDPRGGSGSLVVEKGVLIFREDASMEEFMGGASRVVEVDDDGVVTKVIKDDAQDKSKNH